jgi:hypothetical protein
MQQSQAPSTNERVDHMLTLLLEQFSTTIFDLGFEYLESLELWSAALRKYAKEEREAGFEESAAQLILDADSVESRYHAAWGHKSECSKLFRGMMASHLSNQEQDPEDSNTVQASC